MNQTVPYGTAPLGWLCPRHFVPGYDRTVPPGHFATGYSLVLTFGINAPSVIIAGVGSVCGAAGSQYL